MHNSYFDKIISWNKTQSLIASFIDSIADSSPEAIILTQLLSSFSSIGVELNPFIQVDLHKNQPADDLTDIPPFVKAMRKNLGMTQEEFAKEARVGLRFLRELEQGKKETLRSDKVNQALKRFGCVLAPVFQSEYKTNES